MVRYLRKEFLSNQKFYYLSRKHAEIYNNNKKLCLARLNSIIFVLSNYINTDQVNNS